MRIGNAWVLALVVACSSTTTPTPSFNEEAARKEVEEQSACKEKADNGDCIWICATARSAVTEKYVATCSASFTECEAAIKDAKEKAGADLKEVSACTRLTVTPKANPLVAAVERFTDSACACQDGACAEKVQEDFMKFIADNAGKKGNETEKKKVEELAERMMKCILDAQAKGAPAPAPPP